MPAFIPRGFGWNRDLPDSRDYTPETSAVFELMDPLTPAPSLPDACDLGEFFPQARDQGALDSCIAHSCVGLYEYFQRRVYGALRPFARGFVHQIISRLSQFADGNNMGLRTGLKALVRFGVPPERYSLYSDEGIAEPRDPFLFQFGLETRSVCYVRLDGRNSTGEQTLNRIRSFLAAGFPVAFGFPVPTSITRDPDILYRPRLDDVLGGQSAIAIGYDDVRRTSGHGALRFWNSWGDAWGENGCGWLPYAYVRDQLAADFWTILSPGWLACGEFLRPTRPSLEPAD